MRTSQRLKNVAAELCDIVALDIPALNGPKLAKFASRILAVAWQVELDERSIIVCPNCDSDLPEGCGGTFVDEGKDCWLNRRTPATTGDPSA